MNYLKLNDPGSTWAIDIETDDLKATTIWCCCVRNFLTKEEITFYDKETFNGWLKEDFTFVGHNAISFDVPVLNKLWSSGINLVERVIDTMVLSYLYRPALEGGHSLEAWGERLNNPKGIFSDWSKLSDEMVVYCKQDVALTIDLYNALTKRMNGYGYSEKSADIEHRTRILLDQQQTNGFFFDRVAASSFRDELRRKQSDISESLQQLFPPRLEEVARYTFRRLKDGSPTASYEKHVNKYPRVEHQGNEYLCFDYVPFNLGSPKQRVSRLLELGWEPLNFTPTKTEQYPNGFPKVDEDALVKFAEQSKRPEVAALAEWLVLQGRASMLDTWFNNLGSDSRIHGKVITCGASTRRAIHNSPNSANIPSGAKAKYGHECRSFWGVEPDKGLVLVGADASGLENVGLLHYLNNPKAIEVLNQKKPNDIHSMNARLLTELLGRSCDREWVAKTGWYAFIYGAYPKKLGWIAKGDEADGEAMQEVFFRNCPGLRELIEHVQKEWKANGGRIKTIDGGWVWCPSVNAALNYLVQSLGAIVMKLACILLHEEAAKIGLWFRQVGWIHDEFQMETRKEDGERLGELAVSCITKAAEQLGFRIALGGTYHIGLTWDETH